VCLQSHQQNATQRTAERELQAFGKTWTQKTHVDTEPLTATCLHCPVADLFSPKWIFHPTKWEKCIICFRGNHIF
jgi:hypothetical protein